MRIATVSAIPISIPFHHDGPETGFGGKIWHTLEHLLVRVDTDGGLTGWGEAFGSNAILVTKSAIDEVLAPLVIDRELTDVPSLMADLEWTLHMYGSRSGVMSYALSGLDIALWDIAGKAAGLPVAEMLGYGPARERVTAYASLFRFRDPDVVADVCAHAAADGYSAIKLHEWEVGEVQAARAAVGDDVDLMLDVNCRWSVDEAVQKAPALRDLGIVWLEEPVWPPDDFAALSQVRAETGLVIAAGENAGNAAEIERLIAHNPAAVVQPSVTKIGGLTELRRTLELAARTGTPIAPHSPYFGPGYLATLQLAAAVEAIELAETLYAHLDDDMYEGRLDMVDGAIAVPTGPGLGLDPSPAFLERHSQPLQGAR